MNYCNLLLIRWIKLILSVFKGSNYYLKLIDEDKVIPIKEALKILNNQIKLFKLRNNFFINFTVENLKNFTFLQNFK